MALLKMNSKKWVSGLPSPLPDDRPITSINVVEDIDKCPANFSVVSKTYDQDMDADLWRENGLFIKKKGRYICLSKSEGPMNYVVQDIVVINERETPPDGFSMITRTVDSEQRPWRKKQVCYKLGSKASCSKAVTDIIICSRIKKAPTGFTYAGEINGVIVCYKSSQMRNDDLQAYENIELLEKSWPNETKKVEPQQQQRLPPERPPKPKISASKAAENLLYPKILDKSEEDAADRDYQVLNRNARIGPTRPAPQPPTSALVGQVPPIYATLAATSELDGVPFVLNPALTFHQESAAMDALPHIRLRTQKEMDKEYHYDFRAERET